MLDDHRRKAVAAVGDFSHRANLAPASLPSYPVTLTTPSAPISAALQVDSVPERALLGAEGVDVFALSAEVDAENAGVLGRPKFAVAIPLAA